MAEWERIRLLVFNLSECSSLENSSWGLRGGVGRLILCYLKEPHAEMISSAFKMLIVKLLEKVGSVV